MKRNFVNPLRLPGAVGGFLYWSFFFVVRSDHRFQTNRKGAKAFYIYMAIMLVYYVVYVQHVQFFSPEKQEKFMKVYILTANQKRKMSPLGRSVHSALQMTGMAPLVQWVGQACGLRWGQHSSDANGTRWAVEHRYFPSNKVAGEEEPTICPRCIHRTTRTSPCATPHRIRRTCIPPHRRLCRLCRLCRQRSPPGLRFRRCRTP
jgi:hypothetical protein